MRLPNHRALMVAAHDILIAVFAWVAAFQLRFNFDVPASYSEMAWLTLPWAVTIQGLAFWYFGLYRGIWRYSGLSDLKRIMFATLAAACVLISLLTVLQVSVPRSVLVLDPLLLAFMMSGSRMAYRMRGERRRKRRRSTVREPVLVLGAGRAGANLISELAGSSTWRVMGVLDDDRNKHGREIHGIPILGPLTDLSLWCSKLDIGKAIIALPSASHQIRRRALEICEAAGIHPMTVPSYDDLMGGKVMVSQVRHVELDDLLGRDPVTLDSPKLSDWICDRVVMVTGAGGSIGAEICRQVLRFRPAALIAVDIGEHALYQIEQELPAAAPHTTFVWAIGDVKNADRIDDILRVHLPSVIFHAAAYKHVPLMEEANAWEALTNNTLGTYVIARSAIRNGVEKFVLISTDKAVNPINVMGASKRLAEMVCQALQTPGCTSFVMVRFGNVLGSTGSVVPKFRAQIAAGGPVTVTHPEIRRYFMSISEAAQLVLQAAVMGQGGEVFVLDMGEPVKIADLARDLIRLSGFDEAEIEIKYTGLRSGEKLYEELLASDENSLPTPHPKLRIAKVRGATRDWVGALIEWLRSAPPSSTAEIRRQLASWLPEYSPAQAIRRDQDPTPKRASALSGVLETDAPISLADTNATDSRSRQRFLNH